MTLCVCCQSAGGGRLLAMCHTSTSGVGIGIRIPVPHSTPIPFHIPLIPIHSVVCRFRHATLLFRRRYLLCTLFWLAHCWSPLPEFCFIFCSALAKSARRFSLSGSSTINFTLSVSLIAQAPIRQSYSQSLKRIFFAQKWWRRLDCLDWLRA